MNDSTKVIYRELQDRLVKVIWTHKVHLCQADIHTKRNKRRNNTLLICSVLVSAAAITNIFKWLPESVILPLLALLSLLLTFFTLKFKAENLDKAASENECFAATMHNLRNQYSSLLSDIKAGVLSDKEIIRRRDQLEKDEGLIYSGIVPATTVAAVAVAEKALKIKLDSTTTDDEIELLVSSNLQL